VDNIRWLALVGDLVQCQARTRRTLQHSLIQNGQLYISLTSPLTTGTIRGRKIFSLSCCSRNACRIRSSATQYRRLCNHTMRKAEARVPIRCSRLLAVRVVGAVD